MTGFPDPPREPGENYVAYRNRCLRLSGRDDIEWIETPGGSMALRKRDRPQARMDFGE